MLGTTLLEKTVDIARLSLSLLVSRMCDAPVFLPKAWIYIYPVCCHSNFAITVAPGRVPYNN